MSNPNRPRYEKETVVAETHEVTEDPVEDVVETPDETIETPEVEKDPVEIPKDPKKPIKLRVFNCSMLNVRKAPDPDAEVLGKVAKGTIVHASAENEFDKFYEIPFEGSVGYINKDYVETI